MRFAMVANAVGKGGFVHWLLPPKDGSESADR